MRPLASPSFNRAGLHRRTRSNRSRPRALPSRRISNRPRQDSSAPPWRSMTVSCVHPLRARLRPAAWTRARCPSRRFRGHHRGPRDGPGDGGGSEIDFEYVAPGTLVRIRALANDRELAGTIARRSPAADPSTRTVHFEIDVPDPKRQLPVGTTAELTIDVGKPKPATRVPLIAASVRGSKAALFTVRTESHTRCTARCKESRERPSF